MGSDAFPRGPPSLQLQNPFWEFSLRVYGAAGVREECLGLQDSFGVDVNLLLFMVWLGADRRVALTPEQIEKVMEEASAWSAEVVRPLRRVRRALGSGMAEPVRDLRRRVEELELHAEQIEQALLYDFESHLPRQTGGGPNAARTNVVALLSRYTATAALPHALLSALERGS